MTHALLRESGKESRFDSRFESFGSRTTAGDAAGGIEVRILDERDHHSSLTARPRELILPGASSMVPEVDFRVDSNPPCCGAPGAVGLGGFARVPTCTRRSSERRVRVAELVDALA